MSILTLPALKSTSETFADYWRIYTNSVGGLIFFAEVIVNIFRMLLYALDLRRSLINSRQSE